MNRRFEVIPHLHPLLARVASGRVEVEGIHVGKTVLFVAWLAVVGGFYEGFDAELVGFAGAPAYQQTAGSSSSVLGVDEADGEYWQWTLVNLIQRCR